MVYKLYLDKAIFFIKHLELSEKASFRLLCEVLMPFMKSFMLCKIIILQYQQHSEISNRA